MRNIHQKYAILSTALCTAVLLQACGNRSAATSADHIRGTVQSLDGQALTVATAGGPVRVQLERPTAIGRVVHADRQHITGGSFLGITSVTEPNGSERAIEVHVFPEAMRGSGEGSYAWDLPGVAGSASRMTNGTASSSRMTNGTVSALGSGSAVTLLYKDGTSKGSQTISIPADIPVVAIEPGALADLQPGAHVFVVAHRTSGGGLTADRVLAGKDGVVPPM